MLPLTVRIFLTTFLYFLNNKLSTIFAYVILRYVFIVIYFLFIYT